MGASRPGFLTITLLTFRAGPFLVVVVGGAVVDSLAASLTLTHNTVPALDPAVVTSKNVSGHRQIGPGDKVTHSHEALTQVEYLALHFAESTLNS